MRSSSRQCLYFKTLYPAFRSLARQSFGYLTRRRPAEFPRKENPLASATSSVTTRQSLLDKRKANRASIPFFARGVLSLDSTRHRHPDLDTTLSCRDKPRAIIKNHLDLENNINLLCAAAAIAAAVSFVSWALLVPRGIIDQEDDFLIAQSISDMTSNQESGHVGNLTPAQEEKLRKLWLAVFHVYGFIENGDVNSIDAHLSPDNQTTVSETQKRKLFQAFRRKDIEKMAASSDSPDDDKYGQTKRFQELLAKENPETIRQTIWDMVKHDHPDAIALRFLRARKWDVKKALIMMICAMSWRHNEMKVDHDIMRNGEGAAAADEQGANGEAKRVTGRDFMAQIRMGKSFLHGVDRQGRPICVVRVRLHKQGEQREESLERFTVFVIETTRMVLTPPADTATIVFDMTGFSMANMDYTPVKFMIECFEANFPESLGAILVHNAPWIFQGIWKVIRGWLDPVVAAKIRFTNNRSGLEEFIEPSRILKELGGDEDWSYKYVEPMDGENDLMKDEEARDSLLQARDILIKDFESATLQWIQSPGGESGQRAKARRDDLAVKLREAYWRLDPYIRARSLYDRQGVIRGGAEVQWYPVAEKKTGRVNVSVAPTTLADDVD